MINEAGRWHLLSHPKSPSTTQRAGDTYTLTQQGGIAVPVVGVGVAVILGLETKISSVGSKPELSVSVISCIESSVSGNKDIKSEPWDASLN